MLRCSSWKSEMAGREGGGGRRGGRGVFGNVSGKHFVQAYFCQFSAGLVHQQLRGRGQVLWRGHGLRVVLDASAVMNWLIRNLAPVGKIRVKPSCGGCQTQ